MAVISLKCEAYLTKASLLAIALACSCAPVRSNAPVQKQPRIAHEASSDRIEPSAARRTVRTSIVGIDTGHQAPSVDVLLEISPEFGPVLGLGKPPHAWELLVDGEPWGRAAWSRLSIPIEPRLGDCVLVRFDVGLGDDWRVLSVRGRLSVRVATDPVHVDVPWADFSKEIVTGKVHSRQWTVGALQPGPAPDWRLLEYTWSGPDGAVEKLSVVDGGGRSIPSHQVCRSASGMGGRVIEDGWLWIQGSTPVASLRFTRFRRVEEIDVTLEAETSSADARPR